MSWELSAGGENDWESASGLSPGVVFDVLASERRRILLSVLRDRKGAISEWDLAAEVATRETGGNPDAGEIDRVRTTLVHAHLPKLERADMIRRGPDGRIALAADSPVRTPRFQMLLRTAGSWDIDILSDRRRREILSVLAESRGQLELEELAGLLTPEEREDSVEEDDEMRISLHHVHLPKLANAGIVEYDPERRTIVYEGLPAPYESWLEDGRIDDLPGREGAGV